MKTALAATMAMLSLSSLPAAAQTVETASGKLRGEGAGGVTAFLGIPYAAPPTGENRWREPQPVVPWSGVRDATSFGADCAQAPGDPSVLPGLATTPAEDCLFVNVWKPADAKAGAALPVMVWVHGGGFVYGGSSQPVYSGETFARDGVIFVSLNYRLGRFGFFAHPALAKEGFGGNFGFHDQIAALRWVRDNIASFGGDPSKVTVFGESAGGMSMHMLLQAPEARGLFSAIAIQSGGGRQALNQPDMITAVEAGGRFSDAATAADLRAIPAEEVVGELSMAAMGARDYSGPMVDGRTIFGTGVDAIPAGIYADVPVIVGANSADGFPVTQDKEQVFARFGDDADKARSLYDPDGTAGGLAVATLSSADQIFIEPARATARALAAKGHEAWLYRFAHEGVQNAKAMGGAPHASEIPYVFDLPERRLQQLDTGKDAEVAALTHAYWVNFAKTGNPNGAGLPEWPQATADDDKVQLIGTQGTAHVVDPRLEMLDFTEERLAK